MTKKEVTGLMESSKSETDWNKNCDTVKRAFDGDYPDFWYEVVILSGLLAVTRTEQGW